MRRTITEGSKGALEHREHAENDRVDEAGSVHEEKTFCNQPSSNKIFGRSIIFLKLMFDKLERWKYSSRSTRIKFRNERGCPKSYEMTRRATLFFLTINFIWRLWENDMKKC